MEGSGGGGLGGCTNVDPVYIMLEEAAVPEPLTCHPPAVHPRPSHFPFLGLRLRFDKMRIVTCILLVSAYINPMRRLFSPFYEMRRDVPRR